MTSDEHIAKAEGLLVESKEQDRSTYALVFVAMAHVHAQLATTRAIQESTGVAALGSGA